MRIKVHFPWGDLHRFYEAERVLLSTGISADEADALLCIWEPKEELLHFQGVKGWVSDEPLCSSVSIRKSPAWRRVIARLRDEEVFHHARRETRCQVDPVLHWGDLSIKFTGNERRSSRAVAVISNCGLPLRRSRDMRRRLKFALDAHTDLYGSRNSWRRFRWWPWSYPAPPVSYCGECEGYWGSDAKLALMSRYQVAVCLENSCEPEYFTEKFVDAVRAGCIPVYHAHDSVSSGILGGAMWVDPADFSFAPPACLAFALEQDIKTFQDANTEWLHSEEVQNRSFDAMLKKVAMALWVRWKAQTDNY